MMKTVSLIPSQKSGAVGSRGKPDGSGGERLRGRGSSPPAKIIGSGNVGDEVGDQTGGLIERCTR